MTRHAESSRRRSDGQSEPGFTPANQRGRETRDFIFFIIIFFIIIFFFIIFFMVGGAERKTTQ
ncbi:hypothetical protein EYF80_043919 [Liparis tanakae]|uniref:Uncharacterized protein n=1 Tax=Liparis tanakae TaxID=230148 RepID=A0A4Z2FXB9_9TELE|nr:hypothetical protein EYF80_043919 [Liparis tanakae]